jgi:hypothetical protein
MELCSVEGKEANSYHQQRLPVQTLREIYMVRVMEDLTDIPEWWKKV